MAILSLRLELDPTLVGSVMAEAGHFSPRSHADVRAINVSSLDANLLDAAVRLVRLLDTPAEVPFRHAFQFILKPFWQTAQPWQSTLM